VNLQEVYYPGIEHIQSDQFQKGAAEKTRKWDKEWMRYFSSGKDYSFYFYNMDTDNYALAVSPTKISKFSAEETFSTQFIKNIRGGVWAQGSDLVDRDILEIGCGPGIFGRISCRFAKSYTGIDISKFALSIAELTSPEKCSYIHIFDSEKISKLKKTFDFAFGRHFFIHHNYKDSVWLLRLLRDLVKDDGIIVADFFSDEELDNDRRLSARSELNESFPSALYNFRDNDIHEIAKETGLKCEEIVYEKEQQCRFVRLRV
jgi:SAM-dependent methyltransferase